MSQQPIDFIILCHPRSGSNLLLWALTAHDDVQMSGEIFNEALDEVGAALPSGVQPYRRGMDGRDFVTRGIFPPTADTSRSRGFKLFYEHANADAPARTAWPYLIENRRIHVIHLIRRNLFDCLVSFEIALRTGEWFRSVEDQTGPPRVAPFSIARATCQAYFDRITSWREWAAQAFAQHPLLTIDYDTDLCADFPRTMARIFDFIGVAPIAVAPQLERQAKAAAAQQVTNYAALQKTFRHTAFAGFFPIDCTPQ